MINLKKNNNLMNVGVVGLLIVVLIGVVFGVKHFILNNNSKNNSKIYERLEKGMVKKYVIADKDYNILFDDNKISVNDEVVINNQDEFQQMVIAYLLDDCLMYQLQASDGMIRTYFTDLDGNMLNVVEKFDDEEEYATMRVAEVYNQKVIFLTFYGGYGIVDDEFMTNKKDVYREYQIEYLGDNKFSQLEMVRGQNYDEAGCIRNENGLSYCDNNEY